MDHDLITLVLIVVTFATALNLALTLRLAAALRARDAGEAEIGPAAGSKVGPLAARRASDGTPLTFVAGGQDALVLVFLSTSCPKCREKLPQLEAIAPAMQRQGVALWIANAELAGDLTDLLRGTTLPPHAVDLEPATRKVLNPHDAAPLYVFIDPDGIVQASDFLGDPDWRAFVDQMLESPAQSDEA
jgi:hypothetical protein